MQTACTSASGVFATLCFSHKRSNTLLDFKSWILHLPRRELKVSSPVLQLLSLIISGAALIHSYWALRSLVKHGSREHRVAWEKCLAAEAAFGGGQASAFEKPGLFCTREGEFSCSLLARVCSHVGFCFSLLQQERPAAKFVPGQGAEFLQNLGFWFGPF